MNKLKKCTTSLLLLFASISSLADSVTGSLSQAVLASNRLAMATVAMEKKMARCEAAAAALDSSELDRLSLSQDQLRTALSYFNIKASNDCLRPEAANFVLAAELAEATEKNSRSSSAREDVAELVLMSFRREIEFEERYLRLPVDIRSQLDAMPVLKKPFDLIETFQSLNATMN